MLKVQHVKKWCKRFENGRNDAHDDGTSKTDVNAARMAEPIFANSSSQKSRFIGCFLVLSIGTSHIIARGELGDGEVCALQVPRCLREKYYNLLLEFTLLYLQRLGKWVPGPSRG